MNVRSIILYFWSSEVDPKDPWDPSKFTSKNQKSKMFECTNVARTIICAKYCAIIPVHVINRKDLPSALKKQTKNDKKLANAIL